MWYHPQPDHPVGDCHHVHSLERVSVFQSRPHGSPGRDVDEGFEVVELLTAGHATWTEGDHPVALGAGALAWHLPGQHTVHQVDRLPAYRCLVISWRVTGPPRRLPPRLIEWRDRDALGAFEREVLAAFHGGADHDRLGAYLYQRLRWIAEGPDARQPGRQTPGQVRRALDVIAQRFADDLTMPQLADIAECSVQHLHDLFRKHRRTTPHRALVDRRMREARRLLAATESTVRDIGAQCGYPDPVTFGRTFRREHGCTPGAYRRRHAAPEV